VRAPELRPPLVVAALGLAAGVVLAAPSLPLGLRAAAAIAFAFALPGTAIGLAFLSWVSLRNSERIAIALGGSMSITIGSAFVLHLSPSGITAAAWATILGGITVAGGLAGWLRTRRGPALDVVPGARPGGAMAGTTRTGRWVEGPPDVAPGRWTPVAPASVAMLAAAGVLVALSLVIARSGVALGPTASFTELWLLPLDGGTAVRVGVANHEGAAETYRLVISVDGRPLGEPAELPLPDGGSTDAIVPLPFGAGGSRSVEVRLWRAGHDPADPPHRSVRATVRQDPAAVP